MSTSPYTSEDRAHLLADLNPAQQAAVAHGGGPLLVVAGAGTGKTRVLTRRVAWLAAGGLPSRALLAITFTNKAARVLRERLAGLPGLEDVWAGTFHAFGAWLLRRFGDRIGIDPAFTILDREDQHRLLRGIGEELGFSGSWYRPAEFAAMISHVKNGAGGQAPLDLSVGDLETRFEAVRTAYAERLRRASLLDFDDLLLEARRLLAESTETAEGVRRRFAHVLVDEYQDTNVVQRDLLLAVLGGRGGVTAVGDPDQSIYRWRGAAIRNILDFAQHVPGTTTVLLERNYRSTGLILRGAEAVIARNRQRHAKRLFTENPQGTPILEVACRTADQEALTVAGLVEAWRREGRRLKDVAVFYRVNSFSRGLEMALRERGIPYAVVAGVEFFQRREVKDLLAYARLVDNPRDDAAFLRVVNVPKRGVGEAALLAIRAAASAAGTSCLEAARGQVPGLSARAKKGLAEFLAIHEALVAMPRDSVGALLDVIATRSGYLASLAEAGEALGEGRRENVEELVAFALKLEREETGFDLRSFLERTSLVSDQDAYEEDDDRVSLMSVHAAKGLEFPFVVIAGAEDDLFPHVRSVGTEASEEEERRLFYVAMTRAMERLAVTWASMRVTYRGPEGRRRSPFLRDVPAEALTTREVGGFVPMRPGSMRHGEESRESAEGDLDPDGGEPGEEGASLLRERSAPFAPGDRVLHPVFGAGRLLMVRGGGADAKVTVRFDAYGEKQLLLTYAKLERIP